MRVVQIAERCPGDPPSSLFQSSPSNCPALLLPLALSSLPLPATATTIARLPLSQLPIISLSHKHSSHLPLCLRAQIGTDVDNALEGGPLLLPQHGCTLKAELLLVVGLNLLKAPKLMLA